MSFGFYFHLQYVKSFTPRNTLNTITLFLLILLHVIPDTSLFIHNDKICSYLGLVDCMLHGPGLPSSQIRSKHRHLQ